MGGRGLHSPPDRLVFNKMEQCRHRVQVVCSESPECHHRDEHWGRVVVRFYKGSELKKEICVDKLKNSIDVSQYDRMVIFPLGFLPLIKIFSEEVKVTQEEAYFIHSVDLTGKNVLTIKNKMWAGSGKYFEGSTPKYSDDDTETGEESSSWEEM